MGSQRNRETLFTNNCLICSSFQNCPRNECDLVKVPSHVNLDLVSKQLQVIFLFRNVLDIPSQILEGYLSRWGNPHGWISLCSNCDSLVQEAKQIQDKLLQLSRKFSLLKENIRDKLKKSCDKHHHEHQRADRSFKTRRDCNNSNSASSIITAEIHGIVCGKICPGSQGSPKIRTGITREHREELIVKVEADDHSDHDTPEVIDSAMDIVTNDDDDNDYVPSGSENEPVDSEMISHKDDDYFPKRTRTYRKKRNSKGQGIVKIQNKTKLKLRVDAQVCDICKKWIKILDMKDHMNHHLGLGLPGWQCESCQKVFPSRTVFLLHLGKTHLNCGKDPRSEAELHKINICKSCTPEQTFPTEVNLYNHVFSVHEKDQTLEKTHECKICALRYRTELGLDFHFNKHIHNGRKSSRKGPARDLRPPNEVEKGTFGKCEICKKRVPKEFMADHLKRHDDEDGHVGDNSVSCKLCSRIFADRHSYLRHLMRSHKGEDKPCDICWSADGVPVKFRHVFKLRDHLYNIHGVGLQLSCQVCSKIFHTEPALANHMNLNHDDKSEKISCEMCIKSGDRHLAYFSSHKNLEQHIEKSHKPDQIKCDRCSGQFPCKYDLMQHEITSHTLDPIVCNVCKKDFVHAAAFKIHMTRHRLSASELANPNFFKCSKCEKTFKNRRLLRHHSSTVHSEARFKCQFCEKVYKSKLGLQNHENIHLPGERKRPFVCETCGFAFNRNSELTRHKTKHTGEKPFVCQLCGDKFRLKITLTRHQRGKHRDII